MAVTDTVTGASTTDAPAVDLTADLADAIREAERRIASAEFLRSDVDRAEGYTYLAQCVQAIMQLAWARNHSHPHFVTATGPWTKMGLDNPDTLYWSADLEPDGHYLVRGRRGTTADLSFQVIAGHYDADTVPNGDTAFDDRRLTIADDGTFAFTLGPADSATSGTDHFVLPDGATTLAVREVYSDWTATRGSIAIERVDTVGTAPVEPDMALLRKRYRVAAKMLLSRIDTWFTFPKWFYLDLPVNTLTAPRQTPGGLATQWSSVGHFDLDDHQAIVITVPRSAAPYQGFQLGSLWYISLDYVHHQTSLNAHQAQVDPDGMIRMVVSHRDPGVANWIETTGRTRGIMQFRWQRVDDPVTKGPTAEVVDVDDVAAHLPFHGHNVIDAEGWRMRIAARQRAFADRMLG